MSPEDDELLEVAGFLYVGVLVVLVPLVLDALLPELEVDLLTDDAGLLTVDVVLLTVEAVRLVVDVLLTVEALLVLLPTLMPPRIVPLDALTELDGLDDVLWPDANAPLDSVRARRPWYMSLRLPVLPPMCEGPP